jgi:hypothetical protein
MASSDDWEDLPVDAASDDGDDWQEVPIPLPRPKTSIGDSVVRGAAQGMTLGFADEAAAGIGALYDYATTPLDLGLAYQGRRSAIRRADDEAKEDNPWAYGLSQAGGGLATLAVPGAGAVTAAKAATTAGRAGLAAATGAATGLGNSNADLLKGELGQAALDTGVGAALGAGAQVGFDKVLAPAAKAVAGKVREVGAKVPAALKGAAERRAFKAAAGNQDKVFKEARAQGRVNEIGRQLLDDDVVTFGASAQGIADKAGQLREEAWDGMKGIFKQIDDEAPGAVDGTKIAAKIRDYAAQIDSPNTEATVANLLRQAERYEAMGAINLSRAQDIKNTYKWKMGDSLSQDSTNTVKRIVGEEMEGAVEAYTQAARRAGSEAVEEAPSQFGQMLATGSDNVVGFPPRGAPAMPAGGAILREADDATAEALGPKEAAELYANLKNRYGSFATAEDAAEGLASRQEKNRTLSFTDYLMMAGQMAANPGQTALGAVKGLAGAGGNKALRERGSSMAAVGLDKIGDMLAESPQAFGKFAKPLQDAAARSPQALAVTHFLLMNQDPEYRDLLTKKEGTSP